MDNREKQRPDSADFLHQFPGPDSGTGAGLYRYDKTVQSIESRILFFHIPVGNGFGRIRRGGGPASFTGRFAVFIIRGGFIIDFHSLSPAGAEPFANDSHKTSSLATIALFRVQVKFPHKSL
jgi:hypothetical protein